MVSVCISRGFGPSHICLFVRRINRPRSGSHVLDEAERSLHDALCVLVSTVKDSRVLFGGGWPEMQMAKVRRFVE